MEIVLRKQVLGYTWPRDRAIIIYGDPVLTWQRKEGLTCYMGLERGGGGCGGGGGMGAGEGFTNSFSTSYGCLCPIVPYCLYRIGPRPTVLDNPTPSAMIINTVTVV